MEIKHEKIVGEFSKEEIIEDAIGMKATDKKYSYDKVPNMKINVERGFIDVSKSLKRSIVIRINEIC